MNNNGFVDEKNPLGTWADLKPSFKQQIKVLFKKQILQKCRNKSAIIEIIIAFLIIFLNFVSSQFSSSTTQANSSPQIQPVVSNLISWFMAFKDARVILMPNDPKMKTLLDNTYFLKMGTYGGFYDIPEMATNFTFSGAKLSFVNKFSEMEDIIYSGESNALGIEWANINNNDALTNPVFKVYHQTVTQSPQRDIYLELKDSVTRMKYNNDPIKIKDSISLNTKYMEAAISNSKKTTRISGIAINIAMFTALSLVISSMPDMEKLFTEKDSHVTSLSFMMGMKESAFWFTNFITPIVINFVTYLIISLMYAYWFGLTGSNFILIYIMSILYILSELSFQFFLSTFMNKATSGRSITVILIVLAIFLGMLHQFLTFDASSNTPALTHVLCIFPISAYEVFIMQGYIACATNMPPFSWSNMNDRVFLARPWIPMLWLAIDTVVYFLLFVIFNAVMPRPFGSPPLKLKELFSKKGVMKLVGKKQRDSKISPENYFSLSVSNLTKIYGKNSNSDSDNNDGGKEKSNKALDNVSFDIKSGEVIVMIGPNGAGKSTLINSIAGAVQPTDGSIELGGGLDQHNIGVCFQDNVIINELSVYEHFELFGAYRGVPKDVLEETIEYFAYNMQLTHMLNNRAGDLSGGQKRKLCIGLSLLGNPAIVLMDEPTAGVDVQARQLIWKMIANLKDTTTIVTSHALEEAEAVSSRLFIVTGGKVPFVGTSTEMREKYKCGYIMRVDREDGTAGPVFDLAQSFIPSAHLSEDRQDTILLPVDRAIAHFITKMSQKESELGIRSYSFQVEQIEDMLIKLIQSEEVNIQNQ